ncbi:MAG: dTMP kinase [Armatimonadota bacterium]
MFVTFEGPEGAGKSTAIRAISAQLTERGLDVVKTREPGGGPLGQRIRQMLLEEGSVSPETELLLFLADRANHVETIIQPALDAGKFVLCDRHADSTIVYQGYGRGLDLEFLRAANRFATKGLVPDLTLLFDLDPKIGLDRLNIVEKNLFDTEAKRRDVNRLDREPLEFHQKVRNGFLTISREEPERFVILDAEKSPEQLVEEALTAILARQKGHTSLNTR